MFSRVHSDILTVVPTVEAIGKGHTLGILNAFSVSNATAGTFNRPNLESAIFKHSRYCAE